MNKQRIISWFSCGASSAIATKLALEENKRGENLEFVIAYTEVIEEHPDNKRFLKDCENWFGQEVRILKNEFYGGSIYKVFEKNYMRTPYGSPCTRALKKQVRVSFQRADDIQVFGYTVEEMKRIKRFVDNNNDAIVWPILSEKGLTKGDCLAILQNVGIELPAMYRLGYDHNNCIGCVKGGMGYWNKIRVDFPETFHRMAKLEREKGCTVIKGVWLDELDPGRGKGIPEPKIECGIFCLAAMGDIE
jgi:hypothetical protein